MTVEHGIFQYFSSLQKELELERSTVNWKGNRSSINEESLHLTGKEFGENLIQ